MILSSTYDKNPETVKCDCDSLAESDQQEILWELKPLISPCTSDSVFYEETQFCSKIDDAPFKPCRSVHTISENPVIEIRDASATSVDLPPISWHGYNSIPKFLSISNVGRNVLINGQWPSGKPYIQGGPLNGSYIFSQIHFHAPSEHEIDGKRFPLEMHVVHYKTNYLTQERAMEEKDGTIVLVYLFEVKNSCDTVLSMLIQQYTQFRTMSRHSDITGVSLNHIVKPFYSHYYIYWGSINTMKKSYLLQWIINCSNLYATEKELYDIFHLLEGNSNGRRVPIMKPLKNTLYYAGGYNMALKKGETTQCKQGYLNEACMASQSCQTFNSVEANKKDIQVQVTSHKNPASMCKRYKLCFGKTNDPYYIPEEENEKTSQTLFESDSEEMPPIYLGGCSECNNPNCKINTPSECHSRTENYHCYDYNHYCNRQECQTFNPKCRTRNKSSKCKKKECKSRKKQKKCKGEMSDYSVRCSTSEECQTCRNLRCVTENKPSKCKKKCHHKKQNKKHKCKKKRSDCSGRCSSQTSDGCQTCRHLKCTTENMPSKCVKKCESHFECQEKQNKKHKCKKKRSDCSGICSSQTSDECQTCRNLKCTTENMPSKCEKKYESHFDCQEKQNEKHECVEKESNCSERCTSQIADGCQTCRNLKCTAENMPSKCEKKYESHFECQEKQNEKHECVEKESNCSEKCTSQIAEGCQTCRNLKCATENMPSKCEKKCECHSKCQEKPKKCLKLKEEKPKKSKTCQESSDVEEKNKKKSKDKKKTTKKKKDDVDCKEPCKSNSPQTKSESKCKDGVSDKCTERQKSTESEKKDLILTAFNLQKGPTVPRVLYKSDEKKDKECECEHECECEKNTKICNFLVSEKPTSAFTSTYRLPQLQTKEPLKEFFLQTEHLFHTEKKKGFSMCTSQDYNVTIVYNQNVLQEFKGTFSPMKLRLGSYERLNLSPVYPEPDNISVRLENCFVKMETLNKLYIRAKFLLKQSGSTPKGKSGLLKEDTADDEKLKILNDPKTNTKEIYSVTFQDDDQSKSVEEFITPKTSMNEGPKELTKLISERKKSESQGYEIELLKRPPNEVETSKSNMFDSDQCETRTDKERIQRILPEKFFCKSNNFTNDGILDKKTMSVKLKPKSEAYSLKKGKTLFLISDSLSSSGLAIRNTHFKPFIKKSVKNQNNDGTEQHKNRESSKSDDEKNTVVLYCYDPESSKTRASKLVKSKPDNLIFENRNHAEDCHLKKFRALFHKKNSKKLTGSADGQISSLIIKPKLKASKLQKTNAGAIPGQVSQETKNKAFPSMIPISTKRKPQKKFN